MKQLIPGCPDPECWDRAMRITSLMIYLQVSCDVEKDTAEEVRDAVATILTAAIPDRIMAQMAEMRRTVIERAAAAETP